MICEKYGLCEYIKNFLEPITLENIHELQPGEWIWDAEIVAKCAHERSIYVETVMEPHGFRQIHILDIDGLKYSYKPFMLTHANNWHSGNEWVNFVNNRFYRFKKEKSNDL